MVVVGADRGRFYMGRECLATDRRRFGRRGGRHLIPRLTTDEARRSSTLVAPWRSS